MHPLRDLGGCLGYLQHTDPPGGTGLRHLTRLVPPVFAHVLGVGVDDKAAVPQPHAPTRVAQRHRAAQAPLPDDGPTQLTASMLAGLAAHRLPFVFRVTSDGHRVGFEMGACPRAGSRDPGERLRAVSMSLLNSLYPHVRYADRADDPVRAEDLSTTGLAIGVPVTTPPSTSDATAPWDRMLRALVGGRFQVVVLAEPVGPDLLTAMRHALLTELRDVAAETKAQSLPSPAADHYTQLLTAQLHHVSHGLGAGAWRTAVYLCGDAESYAPLKGAWRGAFVGEAGTVQPVQVYDSRDSAEWARDLAMPAVDPVPAPGAYTRPFEWQTLLTSPQLANYVHLPMQEHAGFSVDQAPRFDSVRPAKRPARPIHIGQIRHGMRDTGAAYEIGLDDLTRHAFITGVTGAGKSQTMRHLLRQIGAQRPFLVIEPAKPEYRRLVALPELPGALSVFTAGDETVSPLRMNPLHVPAGAAIGTHLDLLRSLFTASFALWSPLPQLLDRALYELYTERGFDVFGGARGGGEPADAFPTLDDLRGKVDRLIGGLGYSGEVVSNMRAALLARLEGLCTGAKGRMLDTADNTPDEVLFETPAVVELDSIGDEDDQAFIMGLLMIRLLERRREQGPHAGLRHVLVVEEAHRLLAGDAKPAQPEAGASGARAKAVSAFTNMLAELRSYGQSLVVADQIPTKLAPEVIKNTDLKIVHRLVAADDRQAMGAATVMNEQQTRALATFAPGEAAVFSGRDDAPVLVRVPHQTEPAQPTDAQVAARARANRKSQCGTTCSRTTPGCEAAVRVARESRAVSAFALFAQSLTVSAEAGRLAWPDVLASLEPHLPRREPDRAGARRCALVRLARSWAAARGPAAGWSHAETATVAVLLSGLSDHDEAHEMLFALAQRDTDPFPLCGRICPDATCLFRDAFTAELTSESVRQEWWRAATDGNACWIVAQEAVARCGLTPRASALPAVEGMADRAGLCFAQQMFHGIPTYGVVHAVNATAQLIEQRIGGTDGTTA